MSVYDIATKYQNLIKELEYPKMPQKPVKRNDETHGDFGLRMDFYEADKAKWNTLRDEYHPKRDKFYAKAWERGHSSGLHEVANSLVDLMDLM